MADSTNITVIPSDSDQFQHLQFSEVLSEGIVVGTKNIVSILIAVCLWVLTIWVPYINVGTTIAIFTIPIALAKGRVINPFFIFESKYRQYMGEFFLVLAFFWMGVSVALWLFVIPGLVLMLTWSQAVYLVLDKGINPIESLTLSNQMTAGNKWVIFGVKFIFTLIYFVFSYALGQIPYLGLLLNLVLFIAYTAAMLGIDGVIYGRLSRNVR